MSLEDSRCLALCVEMGMDVSREVSLEREEVEDEVVRSEEEEEEVVVAYSLEWTAFWKHTMSPSCISEAWKEVESFMGSIRLGLISCGLLVLLGGCEG